MKENYETKNNEITSTTIRTKNMTTVHVTNQIHRSPLRRALLLIAPALVIIAVLTAVPARATPSCGMPPPLILALEHYPSSEPDG